MSTPPTPGGDSTSGLTIDAQGGFGGDVNWPDTDPHGPGGGGGGGVVYISAAGATTSVVHGGHGAAGNPTSDDVAFGSADGTDGVTSTGAITFTGGRPGYHCITSQALITAIRALPLGGGGQVVEWQTSSQAGTIGFQVLRYEPAARTWLQLDDRLLPAAIEAPQGALYRFRDASASPFEPHTYLPSSRPRGGQAAALRPLHRGRRLQPDAPAPLIGDYVLHRPRMAAPGEPGRGLARQASERPDAAYVGSQLKTGGPANPVTPRIPAASADP